MEAHYLTHDGVGAAVRLGGFVVKRTLGRRGGGVDLEIDGEKLDAAAGTLVFNEPGTPRTAVAAQPATTILVLDGAPGRTYDATGWEPVGATQAAR